MDVPLAAGTSTAFPKDGRTHSRPNPSTSPSTRPPTLPSTKPYTKPQIPARRHPTRRCSSSAWRSGQLGPCGEPFQLEAMQAEAVALAKAGLWREALDARGKALLWLLAPQQKFTQCSKCHWQLYTAFRGNNDILWKCKIRNILVMIKNVFSVFRSKTDH